MVLQHARPPQRLTVPQFFQNTPQMMVYSSLFPPCRRRPSTSPPSPPNGPSELKSDKVAGLTSTARVHRAHSDRARCASTEVSPATRSHHFNSLIPYFRILYATCRGVSPK